MEKEGDVDYTEQLKWNDDESSCDMGHFLDQLEIGTMVWNGAKSSICDVFTKVGKKFVIEFQLKSGKTKYTRKNVTDEAKKSVVFKCEHAGYKRIFVMICASGVKFDAIEEPVKMYSGIHTGGGGGGGGGEGRLPPPPLSKISPPLNQHKY